MKVAVNGLRWCEKGVTSKAIGPDTPTWNTFVSALWHEPALCPDRAVFVLGAMFVALTSQIAATSSLYCCVVTHGNQRLSAAAGRTVSHMLLVAKAECFLEVLVAGDPTWPNLLLASSVCGCSAKSGGALDLRYADKLVAMFLSVAIAAKTKPPIIAVVSHVTAIFSLIGYS